MYRFSVWRRNYNNCIFFKLHHFFNNLYQVRTKSVVNSVNAIIQKPFSTI